MKLKFSLLLALIAAAGLVAADEAKKPEAPKGDAPKGEGRPQKGGFNIPGVSAEDMKKFNEARKAAQETPEVKKAQEAATAAREKAAKAEDKEAARAEVMKAMQAVREATNAAIIKADPSLADVIKKADEAMKNRGQGGKGPRGEGKGKGEAPKGEKPADAPAAK
jgi:hypothetical protein